MSANTKITLALINNEIGHLKVSQEKQDSKLDRITELLVNKDEKIAINTTAIGKIATAQKFTWKVGGVIAFFILVAATIVSAWIG